MKRYLPESWPLPALTPLNRPFFTSGRIMLQRCSACGTVQHPPEEVCHRCLGTEFDYVASQGYGVIYSYAIQHYAPAPVLQEVVPFNIVLVQLEDFPEVRIVGNVINCPPEEIAIGQRVRAVFVPVTDPELDETLLIPHWERVD
jgi:hypothetical protein